ncbi:MAG: CocE/NonD family hydrolase C-terminal non-catalytic domain-containing protein, partial [Paraglaciecola sp.]
PVLNIYANSTAVDGEIFAYLEEVDAEGNALYLTEGVVRASHRKLVKIANDTLGVPIPSSTRADVSKTSAFTEGVTELKFALQPTANLFEKGNRIRLVITGADMHNYLAPVFSPSPELTISFGGKQASSLTLPIFSAK